MLDECVMGIIAQKQSFATKSNFFVNPSANVIFPNKSIKPNDIFSLVHKYIRSYTCHMSISYIKPTLTTSFTHEILNYLNSPEITFCPVLENKLFCSRSLPLVSTYVGRD